MISDQENQFIGDVSNYDKEGFIQKICPYLMNFWVFFSRRVKLANEMTLKTELTCHTCNVRGEGEVSPALYQNWKKCPNFGEECPDYINL